MKIVVCGSLRDVPVYGDLILKFVQYLGERIIERGHTLLTGCRGSLDKSIAEAAYNWLESSDREQCGQILSYRLKNEEPAHRFGRVHVSRRTDWELTHPDLSPPEQIAEADATIFLAGSEGTFAAANWARIADKPILGVAQFGGAGAKIFERERDRFRERYSYFVEAEDFDILNQDTEDVDQLASDVVALCERVITPNTVFTIMPFTKKFRDVFGSYRIVCEEFDFRAERTDESDSSERIVPRILDGIRRSAFVIADVTEVSPNVFYEIGFAEGFGKPVIVTAEEETSLPFDLADIPVVFWEDQEGLKEKLRKRVREIASSFGRRRRTT